MADARAARDALEANRRAAQALAQRVGVGRTEEVLRRSAKLLEEKLARVAPSLGEDSFTVVQLRSALAQVRDVLATVTIPGLRGAVLDTATLAAEASAKHTADYLAVADESFRGVGEQPLAIKKASMMDKGVKGAQSSVLRRLTEGVARTNREKVPYRKGKIRAGILSRYGMETIKHFEQTLQAGMIAKQSWIEMREEITKKSPFLQGAPKYWAHRIVRTETMAASNASAHHSIVEADRQLRERAGEEYDHRVGSGMLKILSATFDERTSADSYAVHGQVRRPEEPFDWWDGAYMYPPNRPNDREVVVPHRQRWGLPDYLRQRSDEEVAEAWRRGGRKGEPPERPIMSTVEGFGEES